MSKLRVLYICHNHPALHPGGSEIFAHDLFSELKAEGSVEAMFLACTNKLHRAQRPGTNFQTIGRSSDEMVLWTGHFDRFYMSQIDLQGIVPELSNLLLSFKPDVVHFHHTLLIGVEILHLVKRLLPQAKLILTLHDYYAICANDGQMVKTQNHELCHKASPDACHKCFPDVRPDQFLLRSKHIANMLALVDRFVSPSRFLIDRYVAWGLPADRISLVRNGRPVGDIEPPRQLPAGGSRDQFGYFGNVSPYKGTMVAIRAAQLLAESGEKDFALRVHGGMPFQTDEFRQRYETAARKDPHHVREMGPYDTAEMPKLLGDVDWVVVPSIWWENAPLVIQEAHAHCRPVICSGIGGMAEMVRDGVDGLHFRAGDPVSLMQTMARAIGEPGLWERLVTGIGEPRTIAACAGEHMALYRDLFAPPPVVELGPRVSKITPNIPPLPTWLTSPHPSLEGSKA